MQWCSHAVDFARILINLTTLLLGLNITFLSSVVEPGSYLVLLFVLAWGFWAYSLYAGAQSISLITEIANDAEIDPTAFTAERKRSLMPYNPNLVRWVRRQYYGFIAGFAIVVCATAGPVLIQLVQLPA
jgi:hypothetical protein